MAPVLAINLVSIQRDRPRQAAWYLFNDERWAHVACTFGKPAVEKPKSVWFYLAQDWRSELEPRKIWREPIALLAIPA